MGLEAPIELDGMNDPRMLRQEGGEDTLPRPDLEDDVFRLELGEPPDDPDDVFIDKEVLAEVPARGGEAHGSPKAAVAFRSICAARAPASSPLTSASAATVWTTFAGSFGRPRTGWGER